MRTITAKKLIALTAAAAALIAVVCGAGYAAETAVADVPVVIGHPEPDRVPPPELDMSKIEQPEKTPLSDRPSEHVPHAPAPPTPILSISVEGNSKIVDEHILSVVSSKVGSPMNQNRLTRDANEIFELGFFADVDYRIVDEPNGARVFFKVVENPDITAINFFGNTALSEEKLRDLCFTKPGMIFNRVFFRNDLQRIKETYQQDGYVMARVSDVRVEGTTVNVYIVEPRVGHIVIQGNKRTKTYVIERNLRLKDGDLFNATRLRWSLSTLQGMGFFEDVNVGFEQNAEPDKIDLVITVQEAKTGRIGVSVGYGSQSGLSGGLSYNDNNWGGRGERFGIGFDIGNREQYWLTLEQPYMDEHTFAWRVGAYKRSWEDLSYFENDSFQFAYDEDRVGAYVGFGRKFSERSKLSWFLTTEWQDVQIDPRGNVVPTPTQREEMENGKTFTITGRLTRDNMDPYLPYPKGDVESINVSKGLEVLGGDWDYWKYWFEARYYTDLKFLTTIFERNFTIDDIPPIIAARLIVGDSNGYIPWAADYTLGGDSTLRGYKDKRFRGDQMFLGNAELRLPVHKNASLVLFYDVGRAWDSNKGEGFSWNELSKGYGLGVRVRTPLGNLRLDFAQGNEESRVHFGFGEMF